MYGNETLKDFITFFLSGLVSIIRAGTMVAGTCALAVIDVILGAMVLGLVFQQGGSVLGLELPGTFIATLISLATSAVQMALWESLLNQRGPQQWLMLLMMTALIGLDTLCDSAIITWFMYGESPANLMPTEPDLIWFVAVAITFIITAGNEILVVGMLRILRSSANRTGQTQ